MKAESLDNSLAQPLLLVGRSAAVEALALPRLALTAAERLVLRGRRHTLCGLPVLLQLPRGEALVPGELLLNQAGTPQVVVEALPEALLVVSAADPLALLQAAYHLGNRHVALELHADELRLPADPVLAELLQRRGLRLQQLQAAFQPEAGAYGSVHSH